MSDVWPWPVGLRIQMKNSDRGPGSVRRIDWVTSYGKPFFFNDIGWDTGVSDGGYLPENLEPLDQSDISLCAECEQAWALNDYLCRVCRDPQHSEL